VRGQRAELPKLSPVNAKSRRSPRPAKAYKGDPWPRLHSSKAGRRPGHLLRIPARYFCQPPNLPSPYARRKTSLLRARLSRQAALANHRRIHSGFGGKSQGRVVASGTEETPSNGGEMRYRQDILLPSTGSDTSMSLRPNSPPSQYAPAPGVSAIGSGGSAGWKCARLELPTTG
jgi:hypothetical protein